VNNDGSISLEMRREAVLAYLEVLLELDGKDGGHCGSPPRTLDHSSKRRKNMAATLSSCVCVSNEQNVKSHSRCGTALVSECPVREGTESSHLQLVWFRCCSLPASDKPPPPPSRTGPRKVDPASVGVSTSTLVSPVNRKISCNKSSKK
jgi:hypothetical protein